MVATPAFAGHRTFTWFTPRRRTATEYELYTVGQQSSPEQWLNVGWPSLMKTELLARNAPRHGYALTPLVLASAHADTERHRAATAELGRLVLADPSHPVRRRGQRDNRQRPVPGPGRPAGPADWPRARRGDQAGGAEPAADRVRRVGISLVLSAPAGDCVIDVSAAGPDGTTLTKEEFLAGDAAAPS